MKDDSGWDRSGMLPFDLLSSQGWQQLQAWTSVADLTVMYRIVGHRMEFYTAPALATVLYHDYISRYWVTSDGGSAPDLYEPSVSGDKVMLEPTLVKAALKAKWLDAKGRDSTAARLEYAQAFEGTASTEPSQILNMGGGRKDFRRISGANLPDTGYGS
jgi:hypothetical protein